MKERISAPALESRLPVGSSAKMICGRLARARPRRPAAAGLLSSRAVAEPVAEADGADHRVEPGPVGLAAGEVHRQGVFAAGQRRHQVERLEDESDVVGAAGSAASR
jgi:hypothetical protein